MKRLMIKVGSYEKDGQTKGEYVRLGVLNTTSGGGEYILLDPSVSLSGCLTKQNLHNHANNKKTGNMIMCSIFTDEPQQQPAQQAQPQQSGGDTNFDDLDTPF